MPAGEPQFEPVVYNYNNSYNYITQNNPERSFHYDDIFLIPDYFDGTSRKYLDTSVTLGEHKFVTPVLPANMKCTISTEIMHELTRYADNHFYIMHRFGNTLEFIKNESESQTKMGVVSISVGVQPEDFKLIDEIKRKKLTVDYITIDIAHGHCCLMKDMVSYIKKTLPEVFVIAGNIGTLNAARDLISWGADALKVGIGPGAVCTTAKKTGVVTPMFSTIQQIRQGVPGTPIIADGGIKYNGDITKALVAGADLVMCGKMFAELQDSPANTITTDKGIFKEYYGSASEFNKGHSNNIEGRLELLPIVLRTYLDKIGEIQQDLQSSISYAGGSKLADLKQMKWGVYA